MAAKKQVKDPFVVEEGSPEPKKATGFVSENETKKEKLSRKYIIGSGMNAETVLRLDQEGATLVFEQKDAFLPLSDEIVGKLSRVNKLNYEIARQFHDAWRGDEHAKLVEEFKVNPAMMGSASDKLRAEPERGMKMRWVSPHNVERMLAMGYKVLGKDEVKTFLGATGSHHEVGRLGQTELVAMGIPEELYQKRQEKKVRDNLEKAGSWKTSGLSEINRAGVIGFVAEDDGKRSRDWQELPNTDSEE